MVSIMVLLPSPWVEFTSHTICGTVGIWRTILINPLKPKI
jgi:hypothetical protein